MVPPFPCTQEKPSSSPGLGDMTCAQPPSPTYLLLSGFPIFCSTTSWTFSSSSFMKAPFSFRPPRRLPADSTLISSHVWFLPVLQVSTGIVTSLEKAEPHPLQICSSSYYCSQHPVLSLYAYFFVYLVLSPPQERKPHMGRNHDIFVLISPAPCRVPGTK